MSPDEVFQLNYAYLPEPPIMIARTTYFPQLPTYFSTGSLGLDMALGTGGWPDKGVSVIYGAPYTGKSTLAISAIKGWNYRAPVLYVSLDNSYDPASGRRILGDLARDVLVSPSLPDRDLFGGTDQGLIIVDGIKSHQQAVEVFRLHQSYPSLAILVVSEERSDQRGGTNGGWLKTAPVRVHLVKYRDSISAAVRTNKYGHTGDQFATFAVSPWGIDSVRELLDFALKHGVVYHQGQGQWMYFGGNLLGQGIIQVLETLRNNQGILEHLRSEVSQFIPRYISVPVVLRGRAIRPNEKGISSAIQEPF